MIQALQHLGLAPQAGQLIGADMLRALLLQDFYSDQRQPPPPQQHLRSCPAQELNNASATIAYPGLQVKLSVTLSLSALRQPNSWEVYARNAGNMVTARKM